MKLRSALCLAFARPVAWTLAPRVRPAPYLFALLLGLCASRAAAAPAVRSVMARDLAVLAFAAQSEGAAQGGQARVVEKIVAVVGNEIVLQSDLEEEMRPFAPMLERELTPESREQKRKALRREVLDRMIDDMLMEQQAGDLKVQVSSEEIDRAIEQVRRQNQLSESDLKTALEREGMSMPQYRLILRRQITSYKVKDLAVRGRVNVSDDDVKLYYEQNVRSSGAERKVHASHIFIAIPEGATVRVVEEKRKLATQLVERARGGADFSALAKESSDDAATRREGGDLGWFGKGVLPAAVEEIVFAMDEGDVRGPIRTERGFHVMKLLGKKEEQARPFTEIKDQLRASLYQQELEKQTRNWLADLRKKAHIDIRL